MEIVIPYLARSATGTITINGIVYQVPLLDSSGRLMLTDIRERNALKITRQFNAPGIPPHVDTQRWIYTVPAGKKAILEHVFAFAYRDAAAPAVTRTMAYMLLTPLGIGYIVLFCTVISAAAAGTIGLESHGTNILMVAGDKIEGFTVDIAGGGTVRYGITIVANEFDA